jgi:quercetin dioxygenase-like cupin family protein
MLLQRLGVGAVLIATFTIAACSDGDSSKLTAKGPQMSSAVANRMDAEGGGSKHRMGDDDQLNWGPAPPIFPPGAQFAVVQGDPSVTGAIFTVRLRFPNGYILPPHRHPTDEHVTVLRGTFLVGLGEDFSESALVALKEDGFITAPANTAHFASARGMTEVQVHAIGPFQLTYVHPQDDPTK